MVYWLLISVAVSSFALTRAVMRLAERRRLLDIPNERSSHERPVPRTGGIAIVLTFSAGLAVAAAYGLADKELLVIALGGGGILAAIGLADDYRGVSARWRFPVHILVAIFAVYCLDGIPGEFLPGAPPLLLAFLGVVSIVWFVNLYNFMDGIDAIAGIETTTVCAGGILLHALAAPGDPGWIPAALLLAAVAGFLFWNYPPARVFLGDSGSGFLGFMMALLSIRAGQQEAAAFWGWMILLGVFIVDACTTLFRRLARRQRLHEAHRSHAYQFAARRYGAHAPVSLATAAINLLWLLPIALLVTSGQAPAVPALLIAYAPLLWLAYRFRAGAAELQEE